MVVTGVFRDLLPATGDEVVQPEIAAKDRRRCAEHDSTAVWGEPRRPMRDDDAVECVRPTISVDPHELIAGAGCRRGNEDHRAIT